MTKQEKAKKIVAVAETKYKLAVMSYNNRIFSDAYFYIDELLKALDLIVYVENKNDIYQEDYARAMKLYNSAIALKKELKRTRIEQIRDSAKLAK